MKWIYVSKILIFLIASFLIINNVRGQARYSVGFTYDLNKPLVNDYSSSYGWKFVGNIPLTSKFSLSPYAGYENLKGNLRFNTTKPDGIGSYRSGRIENVDLQNLGIDAKYNFNTYLFIKGGALVYAAGGGDDLINQGIGFSGSAGLALPVGNLLTFELTGFANAVYIEPASGHGVTPYIGLAGTVFVNIGKPPYR